MKREILFRGKRVDNGEWVYGDLIQFNTKTVISGIGVSDETGAVIPETVGQFTGLADKNEVKVFDDDVCKRKHRVSDYYPEQVMPHIPEHKGTKEWYEIQIGAISIDPNVRFNNELITSMRKESERKEREFISDVDYEVIGNIHDNPELLD